MEEGILIAETQVTPIKQLAQERLAICNECPLFIKESEVCNPNKWMNPTTKEVVYKPQLGYIKGCGCLISRKARQRNSHCHLELW